jgi:hypothetical protein
VTASAEFDEGEWEQLLQMPWIAGFVVIRADPSFRMLGEVTAMAGAIVDAGHEGPAGGLLDELVADMERRDRRGDEHDDLDSMIEVLAHCGTIVRERCTDAEGVQLREWVLGIARVTAEARREGGVLGVGAVRVSDAEVDALARIEAALEG